MFDRIHEHSKMPPDGNLLTCRPADALWRARHDRLDALDSIADGVDGHNAVSIAGDPITAMGFTSGLSLTVETCAATTFHPNVSRAVS